MPGIVQHHHAWQHLWLGQVSFCCLQTRRPRICMAPRVSSRAFIVGNRPRCLLRLGRTPGIVVASRVITGRHGSISGSGKSLLCTPTRSRMMMITGPALLPVNRAVCIDIGRRRAFHRAWETPKGRFGGSLLLCPRVTRRARLLACRLSTWDRPRRPTICIAPRVSSRALIIGNRPRSLLHLSRAPGIVVPPRVIGRAIITSIFTLGICPNQSVAGRSART